MKYLIYCIVFCCSISAVFSADIEQILKTTDDSMKQGTIKYRLYTNSEINLDKIVILYYSKNGKYRENIEQTKPRKNKSDKYFDNKNYLIYSPKYGLLLDNKSADNNIRILNDIDNGPSWCYGRGLSALKNKTFDEKSNTLVGYWNGMKIVAKLDPKFSYSAYSIENDGVTRIVNSDPILVDGKYYIYSKASFYMLEKYMGSVDILSATFVQPNVNDYTFDEKNNKEDVVDVRQGGVPVLYSKDEKISKNISSPELLKETQKRAEKTAKDIFESQKKEKDAKRNRIISIILGISFLISFVLSIVRSIRNRKYNERK